MVVSITQDFTYYDLRRRTHSTDIELLFPGWQGGAQGGDECLAVFSPHDDDALLGAGYAILAALAAGARAYVIVFCDGRAGYSAPEERTTIVARRRQETEAAYRALGIPDGNVLRFDYPDFSVSPYLGWLLPAGGEGTIGRDIRMLRELGVTRLLLPNGYREHIDHEAVYRAGAFDGPQAGDPILADWGLAPAIRSFLVYPVWGDFSPEDALVTGSTVDLRGNRAIAAPAAVETTIGLALRGFASQERIIEGLLAARAARRVDDRTIEVYQVFDPRPKLDYAPYRQAILQIDATKSPKESTQ
jgi:LmbE family N-acetylglucosaminyl deacetylase